MNTLNRNLLTAVVALMVVGSTFGQQGPRVVSTIGYANATRVGLYVQINSVVGGRETPGPVRAIQPRGKTFYPVLTKGTKVVRIYNAQRRLIQPPTKINFVGRNVYFSIQPNPAKRPPLLLVFAGRR